MGVNELIQRIVEYLDGDVDAFTTTPPRPMATQRSIHLSRSISTPACK